MDPIADMLTIIRNAQAVNKEMVKIPYSNIKFELANILEKEGFVKGVEKKGSKKKPVIIVALKYNDTGKPAINHIKRISTPGQRSYVQYKDLKKVKNGYGRAVVSTPAGILTGEEARKSKVGGEYLFEVW
ncbi:MAG: 30S ribosomal protein S8 [Candidatus Spechtbacterales bacterium]